MKKELIFADNKGYVVKQLTFNDFEEFTPILLFYGYNTFFNDCYYSQKEYKPLTDTMWLSNRGYDKRKTIFISITNKEKDLYNHLESCDCYVLKSKKRQWVALYGIYDNDKIREIALIIEDDPKVYGRLV